MTEEHSNDLGLSYYLTVLRQRWLLVLSCALAGILTAAGYVWTVAPSYVATAEVNVSVITSDPFNAARPASGLLDTPGEARLAASYAVAERAAEVLDGWAAREVQASIDVVGVADSTTLRVTATAGTPADARSLADAVAEEYLAFRSGQAQARIDRTVERVRQQLEEERANLQEVTARLAGAEPTSIEAMQAEADRSLINLEISSLLDELSETQGIDTTGGSVINPARTAPAERTPSPTIVLAMGLLAGLAAGVVLAFARDSAEKRVRGSKDVLAAGIGSFVLRLEGRQDTALPEQHDVDQLLTLREHLASRTSGSWGVLTIVDVSGFPGGRHVPVAFAAVLARSGVGVDLLTVGDPGDIPGSRELDLVLTEGDRHADWAVFESGRVPGLTVMSLLDGKPGLRGLSLPARVRELIGRQSEGRQIVLALPFDCSRAVRYGGMRAADTVVPIVGERRTERSALRQLAADGRAVGVSFLGSLLVSRRRKPRPSPRAAHRRRVEVPGRTMAADRPAPADPASGR